MRFAEFILLFVWFFVGLACVGIGDYPKDQPVKPWVRAMVPAPNSRVLSLERIRVEFTEPMAASSFKLDSVLLLSHLDRDPKTLEWQDIEGGMTKGTIKKYPGQYELSQDGLTLTWMPANPLPMNSEYAFLLTPFLLSEQGFPLGPSLLSVENFFLGSFFLMAGHKPPTSPDRVSIPERSFPTLLLINELYYDVEGDETDGNAFVELYGEPPNASLAGFRLRFVNGSNGKRLGEIVLADGDQLPGHGIFVIADSLKDDGEGTRVVPHDQISSFDPQNGPDAVQLINPMGEVVDTLGYGTPLPAQDLEGYPLYESTPAMKVPSGASLSRVGMQDSDNNEIDFVANSLPSPGALTVASFVETASPTVPMQNDSIGTVPAAEPASIEPVAEIAPVMGGEHSGRVRFTEVVVDPQRDWNDTEGGNGLPFDIEYGRGTIGSTDEWLELHNRSDQAVDLSQWRIEMRDGSDETESFSGGRATLNFSSGGNIELFSPDERLVIGNPQGDMKNLIHLQLINEFDSIEDEIFVDDGNADDVFDESVALSDDDEWMKGEATIGF